MQIGVSSNFLMQFIKPLNSNSKETPNYEITSKTILSSLILLLKEPIHKEVLVFWGEVNSGISLSMKKNLPKEGYGFYTHLRLERTNQPKHMTIFQLDSNTLYKELYIKDRYINYENIKFTSKKLEEDKWYLIELYHLNNPGRALLYVDSVLVQEVEIESYDVSSVYNEVNIGYSIKEKLSKFHGEMSALYFIETNNETQHKIHKKIIEAQGYFDSNVIFMEVNPKRMKIQSNINKDVYRIDHNMEAKDLYLNIGGIKVMLPFLNNIAEHQCNSEFVYLLLVNNRHLSIETFINLLVLELNLGVEDFVNSEDNLIALQYIFEKVALLI